VNHSTILERKNGVATDRVADPHRFIADTDPSFLFNADPGPDPHPSDANLWPLVYIPSTAPF
jgi:hypothetical protein